MAGVGKTSGFGVRKKKALERPQQMNNVEVDWREKEGDLGSLTCNQAPVLTLHAVRLGLPSRGQGHCGPTQGHHGVGAMELETPILWEIC